MRFEPISDGIYKLNIPFEDGFTSVFAFENGGRWMLMDFGATDSDVNEYIIPSINELGFEPTCLLCSHTHSDHFGGLKRAIEVYSSAKLYAFAEFSKEYRDIVVQLDDGDILLDRYKILNLKGHTEDCAGVLDLKNNVLVSGDSLQLYGIGRYGTNVEDPSGYFDTFDRLFAMKLDAIVSSHDYYPLGSAAIGADAARKYLETCKEAYELILDTVREHPGLDAREIAKIYNSNNEELPILSWWSVEKAMEYLNQIGE